MNKLLINRRDAVAGALVTAAGGLPLVARAATAGSFQIWTSNERSDNITVIDGASYMPIATIAGGKRPRGIHASPDNKLVYAAVSGTPVEPPPKLDAKGNPIFADDDDDDQSKDDKTADGIAVIDAVSRKVLRKINVGSDPEEFDLTTDGKQLAVSNEDVGGGSLVDIAAAKVTKLVKLTDDPEGVTISPDGKKVWFTCETTGDVFCVDMVTFKVLGQVRVGQHPRSVAFIQNAKYAVTQSESAGKVYIIDANTVKLVKTIDLPANARPMRIRVSLDGSKMYVSTGRLGTVAIIDSNSFNVIGSIKVGDRPWGIILSPDGKFLYSANGPSNDVSVVDLAAGKEIKRVKAGNSPWGITIVKTG